MFHRLGGICGKKSLMARPSLHHNSDGPVRVVNETEKSLAIVAEGLGLLFYMEPFSEELLALGSGRGEVNRRMQLSVLMLGTGMGKPFKTISMFDMLSRYTITDEDLRMHDAIVGLCKIQKAFRAWDLKKRVQAATVIQSAFRSYWSRSCEGCTRCCKEVQRGSMVLLGDTSELFLNTMEFIHPALSSSSMESPKRRKKQNFLGRWFMLLNSLNVSKTNKGGALDLYCRDCVLELVQVYLLHKEKTNHISQYELHKHWFQDYIPKRVYDKWAELDDQENQASTKITALFRGHRARKPVYCSICMEHKPKALTVSIHANDSCTCCKRCAMDHLEVFIGEGKHHIKCAMGCNNLLSDTEIEKISGEAALITLRERRSSHQQGYLTEIRAGSGDQKFLAFANQHCRPCPSCHALIYRFAGCNHMICGLCSFDFDWALCEKVNAPTTEVLTDVSHDVFAEFPRYPLRRQSRRRFLFIRF